MALEAWKTLALLPSECSVDLNAQLVEKFIEKVKPNELKIFSKIFSDVGVVKYLRLEPGVLIDEIIRRPKAESLPERKSSDKVEHSEMTYFDFKDMKNEFDGLDLANLVPSISFPLREPYTTVSHFTSEARVRGRMPIFGEDSKFNDSFFKCDPDFTSVGSCWIDPQTGRFQTVASEILLANEGAVKISVHHPCVPQFYVEFMLPFRSTRREWKGIGRTSNAPLSFQIFRNNIRVELRRGQFTVHDRKNSFFHMKMTLSDRSMRFLRCKNDTDYELFLVGVNNDLK